MKDMLRYSQKRVLFQHGDFNKDAHFHDRNAALLSLVFMDSLYGQNGCHLQIEGAVARARQGSTQPSSYLLLNLNIFYLPGDSKFITLHLFLRRDKQKLEILVNTLRLATSSFVMFINIFVIANYMLLSMTEYK